MTLHCDMKKECKAPVTHLGEKGYVYCKEHAIDRRHFVGERTRAMRKWEVSMLELGKPLKSYKPVSRKISTVICALESSATSQEEKE